jgi:hypothetical protein
MRAFTTARVTGALFVPEHDASVNADIIMIAPFEMFIRG